jgi:hypothetical protein
MTKSQLVIDELWKLVKPLLPDRTQQRAGRPRVSDRAALTAIMFVLVTAGCNVVDPSGPLLGVPRLRGTVIFRVDLLKRHLCVREVAWSNFTAKCCDWGAVTDGSSADRLFRGNRLAAVEGVAARRGVGETAPRASPPFERRRPDRLVAWGRGLKPHPRSSRGV